MKRGVASSVEWLDGVDLDACAHKKLKSYAKRAGIPANQSGKALVAALEQHAADPTSSGPKSVAKHETEMSKRRKAEAAAALEVQLPKCTELRQEKDQPLRCPSSATVLAMHPGEYCVVEKRWMLSKSMDSTEITIVGSKEADGEPCVELDCKLPRRRMGVGNLGKEQYKQFILRAVRPGSAGLVVTRTEGRSKFAERKFWHVIVKP
jgi:hypothetical protein